MKKTQHHRLVESQGRWSGYVVKYNGCYHRGWVLEVRIGNVLSHNTPKLKDLLTAFTYRGSKIHIPRVSMPQNISMYELYSLAHAYTPK